MPRLLSRLAVAVGLFLCFSVAANAQEQVPQWEIYGGFDFLNLNACAVAQTVTNNSSCTIPLPDGTNASLKQKAYGWHGTLAENKGSWFGGVMDFSGDYANRTINFGTKTAPINVRLNGSAYPFLFGPRFYLRRGRLVFFGNPLIGGVHARFNVASASVVTTILPLSATHWAYAMGGGADYQLNDRFSIRGEAQWIRSHFPETLAQDYQNNAQVSVGLVFKINGQ